MATNGSNTPPPARSIASYKAAWLPERERTIVSSEEEAGAVLQLGEFVDAPTLSVSEARLLLDVILQKRKIPGGRSQPDTEVTHKMMTYLDVFARFHSRDQLKSVEWLFLRLPQVSLFERSQLATLCPGDAEEAKALIPSLQNKLSDEELDQLVQDITAARTL